MYDAFVTLLKSTGIPLAEVAWSNAPQTGSYAVIALDDEASALWADDGQQQQAVQGTIDLFCRTSSRADFNTVQRALRETGVSWYLNSIQYENGGRLVHYEWVFELESVDPEAAGPLYEKFPGLLTYWDAPYVSAPEVTVTDGLIEMTPLGLYTDAEGCVTQRMLEA